MTTKISINVFTRKLLKQSSEAQAANRQSLSQKEADAQFLKDVKTAEQTYENKQRQKVPDGAVPEYKVVEQTSAQRGVGPGVGWAYGTYQDVIEHPYVDKNKYRIAVGSADGISWAYADTELAVPANARNRFLGTGVSSVQAATFEQPYIKAGPTYFECQGTTVTATMTRTYTYEDRYEPELPINGSMVFPIDDHTCIFAGTVILRWQVKRYVSLGSQFITYPAGYTLGPNYVVGPEQMLTFVDPITNNTTTALRQCTYVPLSGTTSFFDNYFTKPPNTVVNYGIARTDYAFVVSNKKVRRISVSPEIQAKLEIIFPTPVNNTTSWGQPNWADTAYSALGVGFNVYNDWGFYKAGAPSIFDIFDNNYNFMLYKDTTNGTSAYFPNPPLYAADLILDPSDPVDKVVNDKYSAFYYALRVPRSVQNLNEYVYLPKQYRANSDLYTFSSTATKVFLDEIPPTPKLAFMINKNPPDGISQVGSNQYVVWQPTTGFLRDRRSTQLSQNRILPPALFNPEQTPHPLIKRQPAIIPPLFSNYTDYSYFGFWTLFWTGWGKNWSAQLLALGFRPQDLRP